MSPRSQAIMTDLVMVFVFPNSIFLFLDMPHDLRHMIWPFVFLGYFLMGHGVWGTTLGKYQQGVRLTGSGCLICRELQKLWPLTFIFASGTIGLLEIGGRLEYVSLAAGVVLTLWHGILSLRNDTNYWDENTGFAKYS